MPAYLFINQGESSGGSLERFVLDFPGDHVAAESYVFNQKMGEEGAVFKVFPLPMDGQKPLILCRQFGAVEEKLEESKDQEDDSDVFIEPENDFAGGGPF